MNRVLDLPELQSVLDRRQDAFLLDVRTGEQFALGHLPGARNACVHNVTFLSECAALFPDRAVMIVVYDSSDRSAAGEVAGQKLAAAGYGEVVEFGGGLEAWLAAGLPLEAGAGGAQENIPVINRIFRADADRSLVRWAGRNLNSIHTGTIRLKSGEIQVEHRVVATARFVVDLRTMENEDIREPGLCRMLVEHLKSDDFFHTDRYPEAVLVVDRATPIDGVTAAGQPNFFLHGRLTLRGVTAPLHFPAAVALDESGELSARASVEIDRTRWGVIYGSNRFFEGVGKHFVSDIIHLDLAVVAR